MIGDGSQHSEQTTFLLAIDPEEEGIKLAKTLRKSLQKVTTQGENVERTIYGTVIPQAEQMLRKILEHEGQNEEFPSLYTLGQKNKRDFKER